MPRSGSSRRRLELEAPGQLGRAAPHLQAAGQHALGGDAVAHALLHDAPDLEQAGADLVPRCATTARSRASARRSTGRSPCSARAARRRCGTGSATGVVVLHDPVVAPPRPRRRRSRRRPSSTCARRASAPSASSAVKRMPLGWSGSVLRRCRTRSLVLVEGDLVLAEQREPLRRADLGEAALDRARVDSSGRSPSRPSSTALSLPWPWPVAPSEPNSSTRTRATRSSTPSSRSRSREERARPASARPCASSTGRCRS